MRRRSPCRIRGIEAQHVGKIFERFIVSIRPGTTRRRDGAAAIVRSIMDNHGGECGVDSDPGRRTTFWLRFPRRPVELKRPAAPYLTPPAGMPARSP